MIQYDLTLHLTLIQFCRFCGATAQSCSILFQMPNIKLQSSDGEIFDIDIEIAKQSVTIKTMLEGKFLGSFNSFIMCSEFFVCLSISLCYLEYASIHIYCTVDRPIPALCINNLHMRCEINKLESIFSVV